MSLHRILENDDFIVDYFADDKTYRVSVFNDGHFWDECWFPAFKEGRGIELDEAEL